MPAYCFAVMVIYICTGIFADWMEGDSWYYEGWYWHNGYLHNDEQYEWWYDEPQDEDLWNDWGNAAPNADFDSGLRSANRGGG